MAGGGLYPGWLIIGCIFMFRGRWAYNWAGGWGGRGVGVISEGGAYKRTFTVSIVPCKGIHDSFGFWIPPSGFRIPGVCQWNLDSGF